MNPGTAWVGMRCTCNTIYNYKSYDKDKVLTVATTVPINVMSKEENLALRGKLTKLDLDTKVSMAFTAKEQQMTS